jgi:glutamine cyclotransferase
MKKTTTASFMILLMILSVSAFGQTLADLNDGNTVILSAETIIANVRYDSDRNGAVDGWRRLAQAGFYPEPSSVLDTGDVIHTVPAPGSRCQGLTYDGNALWVSDYQSDLIYKISTIDGAILRSFSAPNSYIEGLAWDGTNLWAAENGGSGGAPAIIYKLDPSNGNILQSFTPPNSWPHGITWDGEYLWLDDFGTKTIDKVDPATGQLISQLNAPGDASIGLTWDGEYLWSDDFNTDSLYRIDPVTGDIVAQVVSPHTNPRDMAWDGQYIWVVSWQAATIYQVDVGYQPTSADDDNVVPYKFQLSQNYPNPFNASTLIRFEIASESEVSLTIYDILGREVETILNDKKQPGPYDIRFDATGLSSGTYFYRLRAGDKIETRSMVLLK